MRTRLFSCGHAPAAATISQLKEAASSIVVCWMASSILIMLHPGTVLTTSEELRTCDELVYQPKLPGCTIDDDELPILSISVNCTSGLVVVVNRAGFTHEDLVGKAVVDVVLEYSATNITTGESVIIEVDRNSLELFGTHYVVFQDSFSYEFKACVAFQKYPCWIFNEQNLSCNFDLSSQSSLSSFHSASSPSWTAPVQSDPTTAGRSSSLNSLALSGSFTFAPSSSSSSSLSGTYLYDPSPSSPSSFSPSSSSSSDSAVLSNNLPTIIVTVILTIVGVVISLILALFAQSLCYLKLRNRIKSKVVGEQGDEIYLRSK